MKVLIVALVRVPGLCQGPRYGSKEICGSLEAIIRDCLKTLIQDSLRRLVTACMGL